MLKIQIYCLSLVVSLFYWLQGLKEVKSCHFVPEFFLFKMKKAKCQLDEIENL